MDGRCGCAFLTLALVFFILFAEMGIMQYLVNPVIFMEEGEEGHDVEKSYGYDSRIAANVFRLIYKH